MKIVITVCLLLLAISSTGFMMHKNTERRSATWAHNRNNQLYVRSNNKANANTTFTDESPSGKTITVYDNTNHVNPSGNNSTIYFDGTGDYLSAPMGSDVDFGEGDFTIDLWANFDTGFETWDTLISTYKNTSTPGFAISTYSGTIRWFHLSTGYVNTGVVPATDGTWTHLAVVRKDNTFTVYVNGVAKATRDCTGMTFDSFYDDLLIGRLLPSTTRYYFDGHMDEVRISKGIARWTTDFSDSLPNRPASK